MKFIQSLAVSILLTTTLLLLLQFNVVSGQSQTTEKVEQEIKEALRLETQYFYQRDMVKWEGQWSHEPYVMKCYVTDGKYIEQLGWPIIQQSAKDYMKEHPEPEQVPTDLPEYEIKVFGNSAFVSFITHDKIRGKKRDIRLMVRENGKWKIGYMSTNYYTE